MSIVLERRNSFGTTTPAISASASDSSRKDEKPVPRYLRPSTGSCHDLCKHGHRHPSEENQKLLGGRRKKLPSHLNNLTLHGSVILDAPKDARSRQNISLVKSSISLGEADRVVHKIKSANLRGAASSEHLVPRISSSADNKNVNSDGRKKHPTVAQRTLPSPRYSSGVPNFDRKAAMPVKGSKLPEETLHVKARTAEKTTTVKQPLVKRPASLPTKLNLTKQASVSSQASSNLVSSKDKNTLKGRLISSPAIITGKRTSNSGKTRRSPARSSNLNIDGKRGSDLPVTPFSVESEFTASVEIQEDDVQDSSVTGHNVESTAAGQFAGATECANKFLIAAEESSSEDGLDMSVTSSSVESDVEEQEDDVQGSCITCHTVESTLPEVSPSATVYVDKSRPTLKETSIPVSEDEEESNVKIEALAAEPPVRSIIALELRQPFDGQEVKAVLSKSDLEHNMHPEQNAIDNRASADEDIQTDEAALCQVSERLTAVQTADVYDSVLTESTSESDADGVEVSSSVVSVVIGSREDEGSHEDTDDAAPCQLSTQLTAVQNADISSEIEADGVEVNTSVESVITESREDMGAHEDLQGPSELRPLDEKHADDPKSSIDCTTGNVAENIEVKQSEPVVIEPIDSNLQPDELASVHNDSTFEQDELKSKIVAQQLLEELSDDENYEDYDYELIQLDDSDAEDEGATINPNIVESSKAKGQREKRISALHPDDACATPYKLKFKRGKVVDLTPDSNGPRRLVFRRRATNEVANGEGQLARKIFKRNIRTNGVPAEPDVESPGVKLRHQDTQDKKDAQGLFNNVIEETASKLVESRKSKVKALVGAFETVILLQDCPTPSSTPQAGNSPYMVRNEDENAPDEPV